MTTYHNDISRTGWNSAEVSLSATSFPANFGIVATVLVDDQIDAQPLLVSNLQVNGALHNVVYIATESNTVYALDAATGTTLASHTLGQPVPAPFQCFNGGPNIGITGTPVIDPSTNTLYVIAYINATPRGGTVTPVYVLHALNLQTLSDTVPAVVVGATHLLNNDNTFTFNATYQRQRPALLEVQGNIYAAFGSFCDLQGQSSRGWVLGWHASNLTPLATNQLNDQLSSDPGVTPPMFMTSVWMSGYGIASDGSSLIFATSNSDCNWPVSQNDCPAKSTWNGTTHIQESVVKLSSNFALQGIFTPSNSPGVFSLDQHDEDVGSAGVLVFPTTSPTYPHLAVSSEKFGNIYLLNPANLGTVASTSPPSTTPPPLQIQPIDECWCGPSYFVGPDGVGRVVISGGDTVSTWRVQLSPTPQLIPEASVALPSGPSEQDGGFFTSVSSNGTIAGSAIIWAVSRPTGTNPKNPTAITLTAFAAVPSAGSKTLRQLFSATAGSWPNTSGDANIVPIVANGRVYVGSAYLDSQGHTRGQLNVFGPGGVGTPFASPVASPAIETATVAADAVGTADTVDTANTVMTPASTYLVTGILTAVEGSTLTLRTRDGDSATVDASRAIATQRVGVPLTTGLPLTALGSTVENGELVATTVYRAKGLTGRLWPADHL